MDFVAIDFETANPKWTSVCAVGMVMVKNDCIVDEYYSLINPEEYFSSFNISIHGITADDVNGAPTFADVAKDKLFPWVSDNLVIAHNASFDVNVLKKTAAKYSIEVPSFRYECTCKIAREVWPGLINYRLSTVADYLNLTLDHHNAISDARACANIMLMKNNKS